MSWPFPFDAAYLTHEPVRAIERAHNSLGPPTASTFIIPPRLLDYGTAGHARVSFIIKAPNGLARIEVTRRGACAVIDVGMTMIGLTTGSLWFWVIDGQRYRKVWLAPDSNTLTPRRPYRCLISGLDAAHVALIDTYQRFGLVWTGDQSLPAKPRRMTIARYDKLIGKIREQWDVLSGR